MSGVQVVCAAFHSLRMRRSRRRMSFGRSLSPYARKPHPGDWRAGFEGYSAIHWTGAISAELMRFLLAFRTPRRIRMGSRILRISH